MLDWSWRGIFDFARITNSAPGKPVRVATNEATTSSYRTIYVFRLDFGIYFSVAILVMLCTLP